MAAYYSEHGHNREFLDPKTNPKAGFKPGSDHPNWQEPIRVTCANCGASLERNQSQVTRAAQAFCDFKCHGEWRKRTGFLRVEHEPNTTCAQCGKLLFRQPNAIERSQYHFCNQTCHGIWDAEHKVGENAARWNGGPVTSPCAVCGTMVTRPKAWAFRSGQESSALCSEECRRFHWSVLFSGDGNPNWQGGIQVPNYGSNWHRQRRRARERDNHTCQRCGITSEQLGFALDVHHVRPFKLFFVEHDGDVEAAAHVANRLENLACYCRSCHLIVERGQG